VHSNQRLHLNAPSFLGHFTLLSLAIALTTINIKLFMIYFDGLKIFYVFNTKFAGYYN